MRYYIEPRTRKYIKGNGFLLFERNLSDKIPGKTTDAFTKTVLNAAKQLKQQEKW